MLRRRLFIMVGPLVCLLWITAIISIWLMESTLTHLDYVNHMVLATTEQVNDFVISIRDTRRNIQEAAMGRRPPAAISAPMSQTKDLMQTIDQSDLVHLPKIDPVFRLVQAELPDFQRDTAAVAAARILTMAQVDAPVAAANALDRDASHLNDLVRQQGHDELQRLSDRLRSQVLILSIVFVLAISLSIAALMRTGASILRPVDRLVEIANELGQEHFDARIQIDDGSEFGQLAQAYNGLAEQLQANEKRKMEVLGQVALTMSHELNNAINVIELQLTLLSRRAGNADALQGHLKQIRLSLRRMAGVVDALKHTQKIVLTDYMDGIKMLDLSSSTRETKPADGRLPAGSTPDHDV